MKDEARAIFEDLLGMEISSDFQARLTRRTGWNAPTAKAVDFEYRCFLLLCAISEVPMTPPEAVDIAWHEHILHTRHYQDVLPAIIGRRLHHDPGSQDDAEKHRLQYRRTWKLYRRVFGRQPSELVWPRPQERIMDAFRRREEGPDVDLSMLWIAASSDSPAYASEAAPCPTPSYASHSYSSDSNESHSSGDTTSSCGSSCGGGCGGD